jgi:hypothetical protein
VLKFELVNSGFCRSEVKLCRLFKPLFTVKQMQELVKKGTFGFGVFECKDIYATYEEMKGKGIKFLKESTKEFYGIEALFQDDSGNWFSLGQKG